MLESSVSIFACTLANSSACRTRFIGGCINYGLEEMKPDAPAWTSIIDMAVYGNMLIILSYKRLTVLDVCSSFEELHEIHVSASCFESMAISSSRIITGCENGKLQAHRNITDFPLDFIFDVKVGRVN